MTPETDPHKAGFDPVRLARLDAFVEAERAISATPSKLVTPGLRAAAFSVTRVVTSMKPWSSAMLPI